MSIYLGDALSVLKDFPNEYFNLCVTSPPYWAVRKNLDGKEELGQESHHDDYINNLCKIFDEVYRTLREDGSLYVVIADTYYSKYKGSGGKTKKQLTNKGSYFKSKKFESHLPERSLVNIPHRFCIKMQDEHNWILRNTIIWHKPNAMVGSWKNKFTPDYEFIFWFTKIKSKYYFEQQLEPLKNPKAKSKNAPNKFESYGNSTYSGFEYDATKLEGRNKRCVWTIPTKGFKGSHTSSYPEELIEPIIKAGCPPDGIILDPFFGSGTTAIVAEKLERQWVGIEINEEYMKEAEERIENERS